MKAILFTLQKSFGQCRVLHDLPDDQPDLVNKFANLVCLTVPTLDRDSELHLCRCSSVLLLQSRSLSARQLRRTTQAHISAL